MLAVDFWVVAGQLSVLSAAAAGWVLSRRHASILWGDKMELIAVGGEAVEILDWTGKWVVVVVVLVLVVVLGCGLVLQVQCV